MAIWVKVAVEVGVGDVGVRDVGVGDVGVGDIGVGVGVVFAAGTN